MKKIVPGGRKVRVDLPPKKKYQTRPSDYEKILSIMKQFVREWSDEGAEERKSSYGLVTDTIQKYFPKPTGIKILCPGSGLGRLAWDCANLGYSSQGNEFSFFMLIPSNFILNRISKKYQYQIYPFIHQRSNHLSRSDQLRGVKIPDVAPNSLPENSDFSMVAGDFIEVYSAQPSAWDCIATCFFMDTAKNIFEYIDTISTALKIGGIWINYGPLLYHWSEMPGEFSIELSYDELKAVILESGFEILEESGKDCSYATNIKSMLQMSYKCVFFVAKKISLSKTVQVKKSVPLKPMFDDKLVIEKESPKKKKQNKKK
jgi:carnosine N-methyltransferase